MMGFAVKPKDFEKDVMLDSGGEPMEDSLLMAYYNNLRDTCSENNSNVAVVIDSEGKIVCLAPVAVASIIAKLLNQSKDFGEESFFN